VNASNVLVDGNHFDGIARSVVDVEPAVPRWTVTGVHVQKNQIGGFGNFALSAGGAGAGVNDIWFQDNHVTGGNGIAVFAGMPQWVRHGLHVTGNESDVAGKAVTGTGRDGVIQLAQLDGVEISGNKQRIASGAAVSLDAVCDLTMHDNDFPGASADQHVVAKCGTAVTKKAAASTPAGRAAAKPRGAASPPASHKDSTDTGWLIVGGVLGAVALAVFLALVARDRRRSTA
jgi:hypothetical protein